MERFLLKSKIHRATITRTELHYVGSLTLDQDLMKAADLVPNERIQVVNINNGARFDTYLIEGVAGSGEVCLNGAAARLGEVGDLVVLIAYCQLPESEVASFTPTIVHVDENNGIIP